MGRQGRMEKWLGWVREALKMPLQLVGKSFSEPQKSRISADVLFPGPENYEEKNLMTGGWAARSSMTKCIGQEQFVSSSLSSVTEIYLQSLG